jgi:nitroreductase
MIEPNQMLAFLKERRSIRAYQKKMISDKDIEMILEAARWTPSASNRQAWQFIVIKKKELIEKIASVAIFGNFVKKAPLVIAIVGNTKKNPRWYIQDTSLASMQMILMAWSLGIGSCWIGTMDRDKAKELLGLGKKDFLLTILPFGYYKRIPQPIIRKDLDKITRIIE